MKASQNGHAEVVDTLIQHGTSVDLQDNVSAEMLYFVIIHQFFLTGILHLYNYAYTLASSPGLSLRARAIITSDDL